MTSPIGRHARPEVRGQVLVLTALLMVILIGFTGLAIDVSNGLVTQRWERSVADAAALSGAQDLQIPGSRALPTSAEYAKAKANAMKILVNQLDGTSTPTASSCFTSAGCAMPGTGYEVSIQTPSPSCVDCQAARAVQVSVRRPGFGLFFAPILGHDEWTVSSTSVAGMVHARQYGVVTLRPPRPRANGTDQNEKNIDVVGGSKIIVDNADIGTNTNMNMDGLASGTEVRLQSGFHVYHYDPYQLWADPPPGEQLTSLINDPMYSIPNRAAGAPATYTNLASARMPAADCTAEMALVPPQYRVAGVSVRDMDPTKVTCLLPGIYTFNVGNNNNDEVVLLTTLPGNGVYFFDRGLNIGASLIGGYEAGQPGVALVFKSCDTSANCPFAANNSVQVLLNAGEEYGGTGDPADPAEWAGGDVVTTHEDPILMSLLVEKDPVCIVQATEPSNSCSTGNGTIRIPGNGNLFVAGIQYAPTDNVIVRGNGTGTTGVLGQVISWTIEFSGGASLNLEAAIADRGGTLRLDPACSPGVALCNP